MLKKLTMRAAILSCLLSTGALHANDYSIDSHSKPSVLPSDVQLASCECQTGCSESLCDDSKWKLSGCDSGSSCDGLGTCDTSLFGYGIIKPSESCYDDFISPMTNPVYFEDPRQVTEARAIFINHKLPFIGPPFNQPGGRVQLYALQIRLRLTEKLSLIAVKDGYVDSQSFLLDDGWADLSAGLKYSLYRDAQDGRMLSGGLRFEVPTGQERTLQGNGDGVIDFFLTGGTRFGDKNHLLSSAGFVIPMSDIEENNWFYWSNHVDRRLGDSNVYALAELNWYNYLRSGNTLPIPLEGGDLFNLGSRGVAGNNIVTNAYGLKYKPCKKFESGVAWEFPMTARRGIMDNRLTVDLIFRF